MRHACRNHNDVALFELVNLGIRDLLGSQLQWPIRTPWMWIDRSAAHEERCASVHYIKDVGLFYVDLDVAVLHAAIGLDFVGAIARYQQGRFSKLVEHLLAVDIGRSA